MKKILTIVGARPQFIKAAALSRVIAAYYSDDVKEFILHTGQHYDANMSEVFFEELNIPKPDFQLPSMEDWNDQIRRKMIDQVREVIQKIKPEVVIVYGDTHSTLIGAEAAAIEKIPIAHIEAGLRSFNLNMPEEYNRVKTDQLAQFLYVPTKTGIENLKKEGIISTTKGSDEPKTRFVLHTGDIMFDNALYYGEVAESYDYILSDLGLKKENYILATIHRNFNTDSIERLKSIFQGLLEIAKEMKVVLPLHPRTAKAIANGFDDQLFDQIEDNQNLIIIEPLSFLEITCLEKSAKMIITDSGGVQKEAYFYQKPSIILRSETEWVEIVTAKTAQLTDADPKKMVKAFQHYINQPTTHFPPVFGDGNAAFEIIDHLLGNL
jgi:UDP-GlcNAc3NAcA epimerase